MLLAHSITRKAVQKTTEKFTLSFSNTPGPLKPFAYDTEPEVRSNTLVPYIMVPGLLGLNVSAMSMINSFRLAVTSDSGLFYDNDYLIKLIEENLDEQLTTQIAQDDTMNIKQD